LKFNLAIYGKGGLGQEVFHIATGSKLWKKIIFIDDLKSDLTNKNNNVFDFNSFIKKFSRKDFKIVIAIGDSKLREELCNKVLMAGFKLTNIINHDFISPTNFKIGLGNIIHYGVIIVNNITIGDNSVLNKGTIIGHDVSIGNNVVISPGVLIGGNVRICDDVFIGIGAILRDHILIGKGSVIGMGSVVVKNVDPNSKIVGNPAKQLVK
jgi:sugar O-acyltransferase (sialic acid O-acetyltransferase NeuD family)